MVRFWIYFKGKASRNSGKPDVQCERREESRMIPRFLTSAIEKLELPLLKWGGGAGLGE